MKYCWIELGSDKTIGDIHSITRTFDSYEDCERSVIQKYRCGNITEVSKSEKFLAKTVSFIEDKGKIVSLIKDCVTGLEKVKYIGSGWQFVEFMRLKITEEYSIYFAIFSYEL
jgi:hypothetical protein